MKKNLLLILTLLSSVGLVKAQLTGTKNIPGDYATLAAAIADLNAQGVGSGGVTFVLGANQSLSGAIEIGSATLNGSTNASDPVVINGAGYTIDAAFAGSRAGSLVTGANDCMIAIKGTDYVTIQNCVFTEQATNTTSATAMENAVAIYNRNSTSPFDGAQFITITGCTFNLNKITGTTNAGAAVHASAAVLYGTTNLSWGSFASAPGDMNRYIYVTNNTFNGSYNHVNFRGATTANGRALIVTGNTMNNIGGGTSTSYGLYALYLDSTIFNNNTANTSTLQTTTNYIAFLSTNCGGRQEANGNTITVQSSVTTSQSAGIWFTSVGISREMNNNTVYLGSFPAITTGTIYCLYGTYSGGNNNITWQMNNNTLSGQTFPNTTGTIYGFYNSGSASATTNDRILELNNNTFTNNTKSNSGTVYPLFAGTADIVKINNNTVTNFTFTNNSASGSSNFYGIYASNSAEQQEIKNNTISDIAIGGSSTSLTGTFRGIYPWPLAAAPQEISGNTVSNLQYTTGTNSGSIQGIHVPGGGAASIFNNNVYTIKTNQAGTANGVVGINSVASSSLIYNNFVSDVTTTGCSASNAVGGIQVTGSTANVYHNTIYLSSLGTLASTGAVFGGAGLLFNNTTALEARNNIISLDATPNGDAYFSALRRSSGTAGVPPSNVTLSNNIYNATYIYGEGNAASTATNGYYVSGGTFGTADPLFNTACGAFKTWEGDAGSFYENNLSGSAGVYTPTGSSYAESGATGSTTPALPNDYNNIARGAPADIGALEFAGILNDAAGPTITYTNIENKNCATSNPVLVATISDASGVNSIPGTNPRIYFKKSTEANALVGNTAGDNGWKYTETFDVSSPFSLTIDYNLLTSPVVPGDVIQYFVVAEDLASTVNLGNNVVAFPSGVCPITVALTATEFPVSGVKSFSINPVPNVVTTASPLTVCNNNNVTLSTIMSNPGLATVGTGTLTSTTTTPFYGSTTLGRRVQYLYTAAELQAQGLTAGNITSLEFNVTTTTSGLSIPNFEVKMGNTSANAFGTTWSTDATTTVYPAGTYNAVTGLNTIAFGTPFTWDGTSNIVIEICHPTNGVAGILSVRYHVGPTASARYVANASGCTTTTGTNTTTRPTVTFNGQKAISGLTYSWSDGASTVGATNPLTIPVSFSGPTQQFDVTATDAIGCTITGSVTVTQNTTTPSIGSTSLSPTTACASDSIAMVVTVTDGCPPYSYVYTFTPTVGAPYTLSVSSTGKFKPVESGSVSVTVTDNASQTATATVGSFTMPDPPLVVGDTRCGPGSVNLSATSTSPNIVWYPSAVGGSVLAQGNSYSPTVSATTTYYVASSSGTGNQAVPGGNTWNQLTTTGSFQSTLITGAVNIFDAYQNITIASVDIYPSSVIGTPFTIEVRQSTGSGALIASYSGTTTVQNSGSPTVAQTVPVNFSIPAGTDYVMGFAANPGCWRGNLSNFPYPYILPGYISWKGASASGSAASPTLIYEYYTYNWQIQTGCESSRVPVTATVTAPPTLSITSSATVCNNEAKMLTVTSTLSDYDEYTWSPITDLYTDAACTIPYTANANYSTVYVKSATAGTTNYTCTANNTTTLCGNTANSAITVMPAPVINALPQQICISGNSALNLSIASGYGTGTIQWQSSTTSASGPYTNILGAVNPSTTVNGISTQTWFAVEFTDGTNVCSYKPTYNMIVNNPSLISTTPATRCGVGTVDLQASVGAGSNAIWYNAATGGNLVGTGTTFTTPVLSSTTTYYVEAGTLIGPYSAGHTTSGTISSTILNYGLNFTISKPIILNSVDVFANAGTACNISLYDATGTTELYTTGSTPATPSSQNTRNLGWSLQPGTYRLSMKGVTGTFYYTSATGANITYPYALASAGEIDGYFTSLTGSIFTSTTFYPYFYNWNITEVCATPRTAVTATVNTPPAIAPTVSNNNICAGESTNLNVTSSNDPDYTYVWTPGNLTGAAQTVSPTSTTIYTVTATDNTAGPNAGCADLSTVLVTVRPVPVIASATASPNSLPCGGSTTLNATQVVNFTSGTGTVSQSATGQTPYSHNWEGIRTQYLILASELTAANVSAGDFTSLAFNVLTKSSGPATFNPNGDYIDFTLKMSHTTSSSLTGAYAAGTSFTTVYGPTNYTTAVGQNVHSFSAPFTWNGSDNIVVEVCYANDPTALGVAYSANDAVASTTTAFTSVYGKYEDNVASCGSTTGTIVSGTNRPNMILQGSGGTLTWEPGTLVGGTQTVSPAVSTIYTVTATSANGCTSSSTVNVTVAPCNTTLGITAFIQGYYTGSSTLQTTLYNQDGVSPLTDCDNITVELHSDLDYVPEYTTTAMLSTSGAATATFPPVTAGNYYVVLKHRNSLEVWSATAQSFPATTSYNFSAAGACFADGFGDTPTVEVDTNVWGLWSGDVDQDGYIDVLDYNIWDVEFAAGWPHTNYSPDLDGNGYVELDDYNIWDPNYQAGDRYTQRP